jgi:hypothetical protein
MDLAQIINQLELTVLTNEKEFSTITPSGGYTSDLLSCVMAGAPHQGLWVTLQAHSNIIAVAVLLDLSAVIITEGAMPEPNVIAKANQEGITVLSSTLSSFYIVGRLWELGVRVV